MTLQIIPSVDKPTAWETELVQALSNRPPKPVPKYHRPDGVGKFTEPDYLKARLTEGLYWLRFPVKPTPVEPTLQRDKTFSENTLRAQLKEHGFDEVARLSMRNASPKDLLTRLDTLQRCAPDKAGVIAEARAKVEKLGEIKFQKDGLGGYNLTWPQGSSISNFTHYEAGRSYLGVLIGTNNGFIDIDGMIVRYDRNSKVEVLTSPFEDIKTFTHIAGRPVFTRDKQLWLIDRDNADYVQCPIYGAVRENLDAESVRFSATSKRSVMFAQEKIDERGVNVTTVFVNNLLHQYGRSYGIPGSPVSAFDAGALNRVYVGREDGTVDVLNLETEKYETRKFGASVQGLVVTGNTLIVATKDSETSSIIKYYDATTLEEVIGSQAIRTSGAVRDIDVAEKRLVVASSEGSRAYLMPAFVDGHERTQRARALMGRALTRTGHKLGLNADAREFFTIHTQVHTTDANKAWHFAGQQLLWITTWPAGFGLTLSTFSPSVASFVEGALNVVGLDRPESMILGP
ncbi:MAG: hypothetical protein H7Z43_04245, partial [Clostridia bacterium]|nr:hypothetical protein [Deltaproteobacteria bacterium]